MLPMWICVKNQGRLWTSLRGAPWWKQAAGLPVWNMQQSVLQREHSETTSQMYVWNIWCDLCILIPPSFSGHNTEKKYECPHCDHVSHREDLIQFHVRNVHEEKDTFVCNLCGAKLRYRMTYEEHMHRHMGTPMKKCDVCFKAFYCKLSCFHRSILFVTFDLSIVRPEHPQKEPPAGRTPVLRMRQAVPHQGPPAAPPSHSHGSKGLCLFVLFVQMQRQKQFGKTRPEQAQSQTGD